MIQIQKYNKSKDTGDNNRITYNSGGDTQYKQTELETHTIYGQPFNGKQDVGGDMSNITNITTVGGDINVKATTDSEDKVGGNINAEGTISGNKLTGSDITTDSGTIKKATINDISGNTLAYLIGKINELSGNKLDFKNAVLKDLLAGNISVETLTVTKAAHFFSLIIDEIKSVGGQIILTPANATIDKVVTVNGNFKCYWRATDGEKKIYNQFAQNDQIVCQTFNTGTTDNTYYWRLCTEVGTETIDNVLYNYAVLSGTDKDTVSTANPTKGDKIIQLGNRTDVTRQNAIILSAYNSKFLDAALVAPSIVQYKGVNDYHLETHRLNVISAGFNEFSGNFKVSTGQRIEDYVKDNAQKGADGKSYYIKYSDDGGKTFTKTVPLTDVGTPYKGRNIFTVNGLGVVASDGAEIDNLNNGLICHFTKAPNRVSGLWKRFGDNMPEGVYRISGKIKTKTSTFTVNIQMGDIDAGQIKATQEWQPFSFAVNNIRYLDTPYFGFVDFEYGITQPKQRELIVYIADLMITQGEEIYDYAPAPEDQRFGLTKGNYIGFATWDKPYPPTDVSAYTWNKIVGEDANYYKLNPLIESAAVNKDGIFNLALKYNIQHIVGNNITNINAGDYYVRFRPNTTNTNTNLTNLQYLNGSYQTNYFQQANKITYITVELVKDNQVLDTRIVNVILLPSATFEIKQATDTEIVSIRSRVTNTESKIANNTQQITNNYSILNQKADNIQTQVTSNKSSINTITGKLNTNTTNISNITQKANSIESRVSKIETSGVNIVNDKQFFINSDKQPHQSREYDVATDTYTFKSTDKTNDIDYSSNFIKLDAGKYMLSFIPTFNGDDIRTALLLNLYAKGDFNSSKIEHRIINYSDLPQNKLYTYEFTVIEDKPYLWLYLESAAQQNQKTLPWIIKLQNVRLLKITESESVIKQTVDNIVLDTDKVKIQNKGKLAALFEDGKIKADYLESNTGVFKINNKGFYYEGKSDYNNGVITTKMYNDGFSTRADETTNKEGIYSSVEVNAGGRKPNINITTNSDNAINIESILPDSRDAITIRDGQVYGLRKSTIIVGQGIKVLNTLCSNIIVTGGNDSILQGNGQTTLVLPDNENLTDSIISKGTNTINNRINYKKTNSHYPETLQVGQEYTIYKRSKGNLIITIDDMTQSYYPIAECNNSRQIIQSNSVTIPSDFRGIIKIIFDGYFWNVFKY